MSADRDHFVLPSPAAARVLLHTTRTGVSLPAMPWRPSCPNASRKYVFTASPLVTSNSWGMRASIQQRSPCPSAPAHSRPAAASIAADVWAPSTLVPSPCHGVSPAYAISALPLSSLISCAILVPLLRLEMFRRPRDSPHESIVPLHVLPRLRLAGVGVICPLLRCARPWGGNCHDHAVARLPLVGPAPVPNRKLHD